MSDYVRVILVGTGSMAKEYVKVLRLLNIEPIVVGRGQVSADNFEYETGIRPFTGGIEKYLAGCEKFSENDYAIVAVNIIELHRTASKLIQHGIKHLLLEKPGVFSEKEAGSLSNGTEVYIAYNRRFYPSTYAAKKIIDEDGGITSFRAEFTEWRQVVEKTSHPDPVKQKWFLANSSHVMDLAFYLAGKPVNMVSYKQGGFEWHNAGSRYAGAGITDKGIIFSYSANWDSAGSWDLEINTVKRRLIMKPMETLKYQNKGSIEIKDVELKEDYYKGLKAGLFGEVKAFLGIGDKEILCTLGEQVSMLPFYEKISGERY